MRFWGLRNIPHPSDVDPLWTEKEEEEWHNEMLANTSDFDEEIDLEAEDLNVEGEGAGVAPKGPNEGGAGPRNA
jgi:large subunit ribosomal protein L17